MKLILALGLFILSTSAHSSNCNGNFQTGLDTFENGRNSFFVGQSYWNDAVNESESEDPKRKLICRNLSRAKAAFEDSLASFKKSYGSFHKAIGTCERTNQQVSMQNASSCSNNRRLAQNRLNNIEENFNRVCVTKSEELYLDGLVELEQIR